MDYVLEANALSKHYGHFKALNELSMHVPKRLYLRLCWKKRCWQNNINTPDMRAPGTHLRGLYTVRSKSSETGIVKSRRRMGAVVGNALHLPGYDRGRQHKRAVPHSWAPPSF